MKITHKISNAADETITATNEHGETLTLLVIGEDGHGHYAVNWNAGDRWMAGQFVDFERGGELYEVQNDGDTFYTEDWTLVAKRLQDGGFRWVR